MKALHTVLPFIGAAVAINLSVVNAALRYLDKNAEQTVEQMIASHGGYDT